MAETLKLSKTERIRPSKKQLTHQLELQGTCSPSQHNSSGPHSKAVSTEFAFHQRHIAVHVQKQTSPIAVRMKLFSPKGRVDSDVVMQ